jgi:bacteriocin-like protein
MASIKISDLSLSDFNLSVDSENFLEELSDSDLATIKGGISRINLLLAIPLPILITVAFMSCFRGDTSAHD